MVDLLIRSIALVGVFVCALGAPAAVTVVAVIGYSFVYTGPEVIIAGVLMDAYFGYGSGMFYRYTLLFAIIVLVVDILRPHLSVYNR